VDVINASTTVLGTALIYVCKPGAAEYILPIRDANAGWFEMEISGYVSIAMIHLYSLAPTLDRGKASSGRINASICWAEVERIPGFVVVVAIETRVIMRSASELTVRVAEVGVLRNGPWKDQLWPSVDCEGVCRGYVEG
jgi:hypothetical protein